MWTCPSCGEDLEAVFDTCWQCGTTREGTATSYPEEFQTQSVSSSRPSEPTPTFELPRAPFVPDAIEPAATAPYHGARSAVQQSHVPTGRWEYLFAEFEMRRGQAGWYLRSVNNQAIAAQDENLTLQLYCATLGSHGWELVSTMQSFALQDKRWITIGELVGGDTKNALPVIMLSFKRPA